MTCPCTDGNAITCFNSVLNGIWVLDYTSHVGAIPQFELLLGTQNDYSDPGIKLREYDAGSVFETFAWKMRGEIRCQVASCNSSGGQSIVAALDLDLHTFLDEELYEDSPPTSCGTAGANCSCCGGLGVIDPSELFADLVDCEQVIGPCDDDQCDGHTFHDYISTNQAQLTV